MRRFSAGTLMPLRESNHVSSFSAMRPWAPPYPPASRLTTVLLPQPESPNSASTPGGAASKVTPSRNAPRARETFTLSIGLFPQPASQRARKQLGGEQAAKPQHEGQQRQPRGGGIAIRRLQRGVQRQRQRARFAGDVRHEG